MKKHITQPMLKIFAVLMLFSAMFAEAYSQKKLPATPQNLFINRAEINGQYYYSLSWENGDIMKGQFAEATYFKIFRKYEPSNILDSNFAYDFSLLDIEKANADGEYKRDLVYLNEGTYTFYIVAAYELQNTEILSGISQKIAFKYEVSNRFYLESNEYEYNAKIGEQFDVEVQYYGVEESCKLQINANFKAGVKLISQKKLKGNSFNFTFELINAEEQEITFYSTDCSGHYTSTVVKINNSIKVNYKDIIYFNGNQNTIRRFYVKKTDEFAVNSNFSVNVREDYIKKGFNCNIEYSIEETTLKNATIDKNGNVKAPNVQENLGKQYIEVIALVKNCELNGEVINTYASSGFTLLVSDYSQMPNATVSGQITDKETGEVIPNATVAMYSMDFSDTLNVSDDDEFIGDDLFNESYYTYSDEDGMYSLPVLAGEYFVYSETDNYNPYYNIVDGTEKGLVVKINDKLTFDIQLEKMQMPVMVTFSGKVTDQETGEPIANAFVQFIPSELIDKGILSERDSTFGNELEYHDYDTYNAYTDTEGNYTIQISDDYTYIAMASTFEISQYEHEFYSETSNFYDAVIIDPKADYFAPFDFTLSPYQEKLGSILGTVVDDSDIQLPATVLAINLDNRNDGQSVYTSIARNGEFTFDNLPYGKYIILSVPMTVLHIPGYYVSGNFASLNWNDATVIGVNDVQTTIYHTIRHKALTSAGLNGYAEFEGRIGKKGSQIKVGDKTQKSKALSGVTVYLMNKKGDVLDYQITNSEGNFKFNKLPEGEFRIISDKFGFYGGSADIIIDYKNGIKFNGAMEMEANLAMSVEDNSTVTAAKISPMPVTTSAKIEFNSQKGKADIMIIDQAGKLISEFNTNTTEGLNELDLQTNNMTNGTYFVIISQNNISKSVKFIIMK